MLGVALDLGGPPFVALTSRPTPSPRRRRGREVQRVPRRDLLRTAHEWNDLVGRLAAGGADAGQRGRRADQLHEPAPATGSVSSDAPAGNSRFAGGGQLGGAVQLLDASATSASRAERVVGFTIGSDRERFSLSRRLLRAASMLVVAAHRWHVVQLVREWTS